MRTSGTEYSLSVFKLVWGICFSFFLQKTEVIPTYIYHARTYMVVTSYCSCKYCAPHDHPDGWWDIYSLLQTLLATCLCVAALCDCTVHAHAAPVSFIWCLYCPCSWYSHFVAPLEIQPFLFWALPAPSPLSPPASTTIPPTPCNFTIPSSPSTSPNSPSISTSPISPNSTNSFTLQDNHEKLLVWVSK